MRVVVANDHAGFPIKKAVVEAIHLAGHELIDLGINSKKQVDFPDYVEKAGRLIQNGQAERGILICGSGVGVCIAANKMKGVYAGLCHDTYSAHQGVEHDHMNVLCLGGKIIGTELAKEIVIAFLAAHKLNDERYVTRVNKILVIEQKE